MDSDDYNPTYDSPVEIEPFSTEYSSNDLECGGNDEGYCDYYSDYYSDDRCSYGGGEPLEETENSIFVAIAAIIFVVIFIAIFIKITPQM